jgi:hypothetical protein
LIGCRSLEAARRVFALDRRRWRCHQAFVVQDAPHLLLTHAQRLEAREYVANPPRAPLLVLLLELHDLVAHRRWPQRP